MRQNAETAKKTQMQFDDDEDDVDVDHGDETRQDR